MQGKTYKINILQYEKVFLLFLLGSALAMGCSKILTQTRRIIWMQQRRSHRGLRSPRGCWSIQYFQNSSYYGTDFTLLCDLEADNSIHTGSFPQYEQVPTGPSLR